MMTWQVPDQGLGVGAGCTAYARRLQMQMTIGGDIADYECDGNGAGPGCDTLRAMQYTMAQELGISRDSVQAEARSASSVNIVFNINADISTAAGIKERWVATVPTDPAAATTFMKCVLHAASQNARRRAHTTRRARPAR